MKSNSLLLFFLIYSSTLFSQTSFDFGSLKPETSSSAGLTVASGSNSNLDFRSIKKLGLIGIGNLNTETFKELNSAGKLSGYIRPLRNQKNFITINFGFNVNATNSDTLLPLTFLFPDVGRSSFNIGVDYSFAANSTSNEAHLLSPFIEFYTKNMKAIKKDEEKSFATLTYVAGGRYQYYLKDGEDEFTFTSSVFLSVLNVPDEDNEDYRFLFTGDTNSKLSSVIPSVGCKFSLQVNRFQIFADIRHVLGSEEKVPVRSLRGFNSNIGVIFNATIFQK